MEEGVWFHVLLFLLPGVLISPFSVVTKINTLYGEATLNMSTAHNTPAGERSEQNPKDEASKAQILLKFIEEHLANGKPSNKSMPSFQCEFRANRINHILIYSGSFNPPHIGHLTYLQNAFQDAGPDMFFACAIIVPISDQYLSDIKFKGCANPLLLPSSLRGQLWLADHRRPAWAAVLDTSRTKASGDPLLNIKELAGSLGFKIKYCLLRGIDCDDDFTCQSLGLVGCMDNVMLYLYDEQEDNGRILRSWRFHDPPWYVVSGHGISDEVKRYQRSLSSRTLSVRGFVRVVCAEGKQRLPISSTKIREKAGSLARAGDGIDLCSAVLAWDTLQNDKFWSAWRKSTIG